MITLKCKMCGGDLTIEENVTVCECEYCGSKQTVPTVDDEKIMKLYDRANRLRMGNEFDKAATVYESIIEENDTEAEAYWGLVLCKYGIEYVDDPATGDKIPTCHRSSFDSVMDDPDFEQVMENSDTLSRSVYREQAKQIEEIRKGIIEVSGKEEPYDIFICYKETTEDGQRTIDSVLAQDVYDALTDKGYRVFFSRITLEDKLGTEYEPYIFAALNSAKIMLTFGTSYDYYNAVWVKNEWSRYLKLMAKDKTKYLIPCYKDIDAYDMPKEFAKLQAQDMGKVGAIQDLLRGIEKILPKNNESENDKTGNISAEVLNAAIASAISANAGSGNNKALLQRGTMALEDQEWRNADGYFDEVLNQDAECAEAYLGKLLSKCKRSNVSSLTQYYISKYESSETENLEACEEAVSRIDNAVSQYVVLDYLSDSEIRKQYEYDRTYASELSFRKQQKSQELTELVGEKLLSRAQQYATGETKNLIDKMMADITAALDSRIVAAQKDDNEQIASVKSSYEMHLNGADAKVIELYNNALSRQESTYNYRVSWMNAAKTISDYETARDLFGKMHGYKDTMALADKCQAEIDRLKEEERQERERVEATRRKETERLARARKKKIIIRVSVAVILVFAAILLPVVMKYTSIQKKYGYKNASVGDYVHFGSYNGEKLEWRVLAKEDNKLLLITKDAVAKKAYSSSTKDNTWEKCTLRKWLNNEFYNSVFDSTEQSRIELTNVSADKNPEYTTDPGNSTQDNVFLLSINEVNKYCNSDSDLKCKYNGSSCIWWLRSPGNYVRTAAYVDGSGWVDDDGRSVYNDYVGIRPALWINLES